MTRTQKSWARVSCTIATILAMLLTLLAPQFTFSVDAATPAYVTWRQTDSRWGSILLGSSSDSSVAAIGCAATSTCVLLVHSGVCSEDESVFNPKIGITALKNKGAFGSGGGITWNVVSKVYPSFKYSTVATLSGTQAQKLAQIQKYYNQGYYMIVSCNTNGGTSTNHWVAVRNCKNNKCTIIDTGGKNYTDLSKYTITNRVILYTAPKPCTWRDGDVPSPYTAEKMTAGEYYLKNKSTGTYLTVDGAKAANKQNVSVAAKSNTNAFKFKVSGGTDNYLYSMINTNFVVNPLSDTPSNDTNVTLYTKDNTGTQLWQFEKVSGGYIIHSVYNNSCVLDVSSKNVLIKTKTGADSQIWTLEKANEPALSKITVTTNPTKTTYYVGSEFDKTGLKITATYSDNSTKDVTGNVTAKYDFSKAGSAIVTFYYTENGKTELASVTVTVQEIPTDVFTGSGTKDDPYQISSREELIKMRDLVNDTELNPQYGHAYYIQTADIDLGNMEWMPIGPGYDGENADGAYNYKTRMFYGSYDGNSHYIKNLKVTNALHSAGLFGFLKSNGEPGIVKNLVVTGEISSTEACGGIIGQMQYGASVENCAFIGNITGGNVGGITGTVWNGGAITGCYHTGTLTGKEYVAGIVPTVWFNDNSNNTKLTTITNCYHADGTITGNTTGAIAAHIQRTNADDSKVTLVNCFAATTCAAGINPEGVNTDTTMLKTNSEMKLLAEDLGTPFAYNANAALNAGYPVFAWQLEAKGDINEDSVTDVLDVVLLQKWILAVPDTVLPNGNAADMNEDGTVDVFDLALLKRLLIGG